jgi:hypothetical protein
MAPDARTRDSVGKPARAPLWAQYFEIDRRLLAAFRIAFGLVLLVDLLRRFPYVTVFYTNEGVLPNHYAIYAPMADPLFSVFFACSSKGQVLAAFTMTAVVFVGLIVGYRTKLMQVLSLVLYSSLISRNLFFQMGGTCTLTITAGWTAFLPLGDRFSVDALRRSLASRHEVGAEELNHREPLRPNRAPCTSIVMLGLLLQVTAIYFLNFEQKFDPTWKMGEAVHWVLWQNRVATSLCGVFRMHEPRWFSPAMSWGTLFVEGIAPIMLLTPFVWKWTRSIYVFLAWLLHAGISLFADFGPYSYAMVALDLLVLPSFWLDWAATWLRRRREKRVVVYDSDDPVLHGLARWLARLDTFELLHFVARGDAALSREPADAPLAVRREGGTWSEGGDAVVEALRSTPLGILLATAPVRALFRAFVAHRARVGRLCPTWFPAGSPASDVPPPARRPRFRVWSRELGATLFMFITLMQIFHDNWWFAERVPLWLTKGPPGPLASIPIYFCQLQGWMMFRVPPRTDGTVIVDATMANGRHIDPFTGKPPDYDVMLHGPLLYGELFCDYFLRIAEANNAHYRQYLRRYLINWQELEGRPQGDRLVSFRVMWVESDSPPFGQTIPTHIRNAVILEGP